jgi:hypothetical protein
MAAVVLLIPYDDRGREIIEELEQGTREHPVEVRMHGPRECSLRIEDLGTVGFDQMLDRIDSG